MGALASTARPAAVSLPVSQTHSVDVDRAPDTPLYNALRTRRVVLASNSLRRQAILRDKLFLTPEIMPSGFGEDLPKDDFSQAPAEYAVATAVEKCTDVYLRLVHTATRSGPGQEDNDNDDDGAPDLVIGADTIVIRPAEDFEHLPTILEKPGTPEVQLDMLASLRGRTAQVVTAVAICYPIVASPGYCVRTLCETADVVFRSWTEEELRSYVDTNEGLDCAGGFAVQGQGGRLVQRVDGDIDNVIGFPAAAFVSWLNGLLQESEDAFLDV